MAKDKINETANAVSSRSRGGNKKEDKTKQQHGTARENDFFKLIKKSENYIFRSCYIRNQD